MKHIPLMLMICLVLFGCSDSSMDNDAANTPDQIQKEGDQIIASKQTGEFEIRLIIEKSNNDTFTFQPGLKYIGKELENEILHSKKILDVDLQIEGESILPPRTTTAEGLTTKLVKDQWYSENYEITLNSNQLKQISSSNVNVVLNAVFESAQSSFDDEKRMIISAEEVLWQGQLINTNY
ncbi:hypothetical protein [Paenibacillus sp. FSL K6-2862]|uniref:hypothetical protein n=1 Tax=Paenibacillus sp. FSL K6-2862 TaxID=2921484 RepID=UPI0030F8B2C7